MSVIPFQAPHGRRRVSPRSRPGRAIRFVGGALTAFRGWRRRAAARRELAALDERTLHDIGLSRGDAFYLTSKAGERDAFLDGLRFPPY
jgi:uncharacterized protein YjiS (DUF1127 family)